MERSSGILLHPTSLPGPFGIGDLGPEAHRFVDSLAVSGCRRWQVLPLGPTGFGDSPYQALSSFAGNPALIALEPLVEDGLLTRDEIQPPAFPPDRVEFADAFAWKRERVARACERFEGDRPAELAGEHDRFASEAEPWLMDFALFVALKEQQGGRSWSEWPEPLRLREAGALSSARRTLEQAAK